LLSNRINIIKVNEVIDLFSKLIYINIPQSDNIINALLIEQVYFVKLNKKLLPPFYKTIYQGIPPCLDSLILHKKAVNVAFIEK
jgi:hypothetical protein